MSWIEEKLSELKDVGLWRELRVLEPTEKNSQMIFSSNDYLGLSKSSEVIEASILELKNSGLGACSSRLLSGNTSAHALLEKELARFFQTDKAVLYSSGYLANFGLCTALFQSNDIVIADRLIHASLIDGVLASGAKFSRYSHNDVDHLEKLLAKNCDNSNGEVYVLTESVFSMDGDLALLREISEACSKYSVKLIVDEAHALGVFGPEGRGLIAECELEDKVYARTATLSKACGAYGGIVAGDELLADLIVNKSRPLIYNTGLPPVNAAGALAAIKIMQREKNLGKLLQEKAADFCELLGREGLQAVNTGSQIVPVMVGDNGQAKLFAEELERRGVYAACVRPPTVPPGTARLRFSVALFHSQEDLNRAAVIVGEVGRELLN